MSSSILNVATTIDLCEQAYSARYNVGRETLLLYLNAFQQQVFIRDLDAFLVWDEYLTITRKFIFTSGGYTNAINGDIGKVVTDGVATGNLISFNNTTKIWYVAVTSGTFAAAGAITITSGTGAGTTTSTLINRGPYTASNKPIRKILGVTSLTDQQLFAYLPPWAFSGLPTQGFTDYGMFKNSYSTLMDKMKWITGRIFNLANTYTFLDDPTETLNYYRLVYYQDSPIITGESDDTDYIIPDRFRMSAVNAVGIYAQNSLYGSPTGQTVDQQLQPILQYIWSIMDIENAETFGSNSDSIPFSDNNNPNWGMF